MSGYQHGPALSALRILFRKDVLGRTCEGETALSSWAHGPMGFMALELEGVEVGV